MRTFTVLLAVSLSFDKGFGLPDADMATAEGAAATQVLTGFDGWNNMEDANPEAVTLPPALVARARRHPDGDSGPDCIVYVVDASVEKRVEVEAADAAEAVAKAIYLEKSEASDNPNGSRGWFFSGYPEIDSIHLHPESASGIEGVVTTEPDPQAEVVLTRLTKTQLAAIRSAVCKGAKMTDLTDLLAALDRAFPA